MVIRRELGFGAGAAALMLLMLIRPSAAHAGDMDLALSRLALVEGKGSCPMGAPGGLCANNEWFEQLVSELAMAVAPPVGTAAATIGPRGFALNLSTTITPISASQTYWRRGSVGSQTPDGLNDSPNGALVWNRLEARKGLPFGFEVGSSIGQGIDTSMWVVGAELKWALLEGFHSGLGNFPDFAIRGVLQTTLGADQLRLQTHQLDFTFSKPFVIAQSYRLSPFLSLATVFVHATTGQVRVSSSDGKTEIATNTSFDPVTQTRVRMFLGAEARERWLTASASLGFDLVKPNLQSHFVADDTIAAQISVHVSLGLRY